MTKIIVLVLLVLVAITAIRFTRPTPTQTQSTFETKTDSQANVTVVVTPVQLSAGAPTVFTVNFDTHSVNLDFDVSKIASLQDDKGNTYKNPTWQGSPAGGHHRSGTLIFNEVLKKETNSVTLTLLNRTFIWKGVK